MTIDEQIAHLNKTVTCTLGRSLIDGIGVFALRDIKKGEHLHCDGADVRRWYSIPQVRLQEIDQHVLNLILDRWPQIIGGRMFMSPNCDARLMSFMNHSDSPNSQEGIAIRDISAGEEVTEDYNTGNLSELQKQHYSFL